MRSLCNYGWGAGSGVPRASPEKSSNFRFVSRPSKVMKICPKVNYQKPQKSNYIEIIRISTFVKSWLLQHISHQMLVFRLPNVQIQSPKSFKKVTWKQAWKKTHILVQGTRKALKMDSRNQPQIYKNPSLDPKVSFLVLPGAPGSPQGPPGCKSGSRRLAKR
jgi:hypothetical protein